MKTYRVYNDPGHGWLRVNRSELVELGLAGEISTYSYVYGEYVYLEEDCDAARFYNAYNAKHGVDPKVRHIFATKSSRIRNYVRYTK